MGKGTLGQKQAQTLLEPKEYGLKKMSWERICLMWWKISHRQTEEMMSPRAEGGAGADQEKVEEVNQEKVTAVDRENGTGVGREEGA